MKDFNFQNINLTELERKDLILSLVCINDCFNFEMINNNTMHITTSDGIDININFDNKKSNSSETLKDIIEYSYNYRHYNCDIISNDEDALNCTFKFANAMVLDINKEEDSKISTFKSINPTPLQLSIFRRIILLEKMTCDAFGKSQNTYSAMLVARYIAESIQQAQLFVHSLDLLDYIQIIDTFSSIIPSHDEHWVEFATQMLDYASKNAE